MKTTIIAIATILLLSLPCYAATQPLRLVLTGNLHGKLEPCG